MPSAHLQTTGNKSTRLYVNISKDHTGVGLAQFMRRDITVCKFVNQEELAVLTLQDQDEQDGWTDWRLV